MFYAYTERKPSEQKNRKNHTAPRPSIHRERHPRYQIFMNENNELISTHLRPLLSRYFSTACDILCKKSA